LIEVDGKKETVASMGNGPVNALDLALRKALCVFYPELKKVHLTDYKVRVLAGDQATAAQGQGSYRVHGRQGCMDDGRGEYQHNWSKLESLGGFHRYILYIKKR